MKTLNDVFLVLHIIGVGALLSGFFYQLKDWGNGMKVNAGIIHGAWLMLVTGFAMAGILPIAEPDAKINNIVLGAKSIVITAIFFIAYTYRKSEKTPKWVVPSILGLVVFNVLVATIMGMMAA